MDIFITAGGQIAHSRMSVITTEHLMTLGAYHPARQLIGCKVNWDPDCMLDLRMPGDEIHYPGIMPNGRLVAISRSLKYYWM